MAGTTFFRRNRGLLVVGAVVALVLAGTGLVSAAGPDATDHTRGAGTEYRTSKVTGQATGGGCRMGFDTQTSTLTPPDDSTADNTAAATVRIRKTCAGTVLGAFTAEMATPGVGDFIHLDMRATCTSTGGLASPCSVGQQLFGSPGHTFVETNQSALHTGSMTMVWTGLKRGVWRFEVLPGGNDSANLQFRTFTVEAFPAS